MSRIAVTVCLLAAAGALAACGEQKTSAEEFDEPIREGLAIELDGVDYNIFITRQLNPRITPDREIYEGEDPPADEALYGVFLEVCNSSEEPRVPTDDFSIVDNQGNEFEPEQELVDSAFRYEARRLDPKECIPAPGSVAQQASASGAMLLFTLPLIATENRPLELEIRGRSDPVQAERRHLAVELDI